MDALFVVALSCGGGGHLNSESLTKILFVVCGIFNDKETVSERESDEKDIKQESSCLVESPFVSL